MTPDRTVELSLDDPTFLAELLALQGVSGFEPPMPLLPPLVPVPRERLADAVRRAPGYQRLVAFVDWVGDGRELTAKGDLTLADARHLLTLLRTGDPVDEEVGDRAFAAPGGTETPGVDLVFRWARKSGFVKVRRGRVEPTRRAVRLARDPLAAWERAFAGSLDVGIIQHHYRHCHAPWQVPPWAGDLDEAVEALLVLLHAAREAQPVDELVALAWEVVEAAWEVDELPPEDYEQWRGAAARDVKAALALFVELGALEALEPGAASGPGGLAGGVTLTDLGRKGVHERAREAGIDVPVAGALREASAGELLAALADQPDLVARSEALAWLGERQPAAAARDVVAALQAATPSLDEVGVGLAMLSEIGDDAVPAMRALAEDDQLGAFAGGWLVERGLAAPLVEPAAVVLGVAAVADAEMAADAFLELPVAVQRQVIDDLCHQGGPQAEEVLAAVAATHPDKAVAKAARRARFRLARGRALLL
jgi:hypothetical protein